MLRPDEEFFRIYKEKRVDPAEEWRNAFADDFRMHTPIPLTAESFSPGSCAWSSTMELRFS